MTLTEELKARAARESVPIMADEGMEMLLATIEELRPKSILEIGTAIGYSGYRMLNAAPLAHLTTIEIDEERYTVAADTFRRAGMRERVTMHLGDCIEIVRYLNSKFDLIMLDGPKGHYCQMLPYLLPLLCDGGVLFADDVYYKGKLEVDGTIPHKHRTIVRELRDFIDTLQHTDYLSVSIRNDIGEGILIATRG